MAANDTLGLNQSFQIYHENGSAYEGLVMHKAATDSVVMSLGDSISGDVYWHDNELSLTLKEYITYNGVNYVLVNPPTIVREGMVSDNSELKGMTKYSFKFYHPMYQLGNIPFTDVAVTNDQKKYLSENKVFSWIGTANDFLAKLNKNLDGTQWMVEMSSKFPNDKKTEMSDVLAFDKNSVADALKTAYDTWGVPYVIDVTTGNEEGYTNNKHFKVVWGLPSNEIYENATKKQQNLPYIFKMGKGVGLKNNSRTPRNNKIITRIAGYGSETNIPYGYPQIVWTGNQSWNYTVNNNPNAANSYPIYDGIVGGQKVRLIKHPFTRPHLMPTVYVNAVNNKVNPNASGYRADTVLVDYYDATAADHYPNPINLQAPSYDIHEFEDIKPELGSVAITAVTPLNPDLTPASSWDDTMDDDGNFVQSYFMVTLPVLSFDIYACAAITEAMEINMRSGDCLGCTFPVEVDWEDYKANFYNEDGEFDPVIHSSEGDGHVRNGRKYPNSATTAVSLILKKENTTFGTLMPNTYQHPHSGDTFVVLGISLPTRYIEDAQTRLDEAMKSYMLENNVHYYDYPLKFDEAFLRNNTYILNQLKPNATVRFEFAGETLTLYVKQINVKFGEGVLPKYDITLTDNVEVVLNQIGQVADDVEKLSSLLSLLRQSYDSNVWVALAKKLSKTDDDTAQGFIRFVKGLQVGERFDSGLLGEGGVFRKDADGTTYIEADKLYIRMKAYFDTVEIRKYMHSGGNRIASPAGAKCVRVENMAWYASEGKFVPVDEYGTYRKKDINDEEYVVATGLTIVRYRCYFRGEDNDGDKVTNDFVVGDQAYCHITNGDTASLLMHNYWRLVVAKNQNGSLTEDGEFWIDLANYVDAYGQPANLQWTNSRGVVVNHKSHQAGSDIPREQDDIVQLGNADDTTRQGAIIEYSSGEDSPSYKIYQGIDDFSFEGTNYISLGYDSGTGRAYMNVYGDFFFGAKPNPTTGESPTFIQYNAETKELKIKAEVEFIHPNEQGEPESTSMVDFANAVKESIEDLQGQIDGEIDTWYYEGVPTLNNLPASQWYDATQEPVYDVRSQHIGDLYYDKENGDAYRFILDTSVTPNEYKWIQLHDDAITEALRLAADAKDTADNKRRVFLTQPVPPYDQGDLWVNATYPANYTGETDESQHKYNNEILKCIVAVPVKDPETGDVTRNSFLIDDWSLSNGYTSRFNDFLYNTYAPFISNIQGQVDQKAETWYQDSNPATAWYDATQEPVYDVRAQHVGDIWMDTSANGGKQTKIYQYITSRADYDWLPQEVPDEVFDYADGKCAIYVNNPTSTQNPYPTNYHEKDMWILPIDGTNNTYTIGGVEFKAGEVLFSSADSTSFVAAHWSKKLRYTGDERIDEFIYQIINGASGSSDQVTAANAINAVTGALNASPTLINGGLVLTTLIGMRDGNNNVWSGISGLYKTAEIGTGYKGHGIAAWYGGGMADWEVYLETLTPTQQQSATITDAYAKSLFRFDGSGYLAGGNITWDKNGSIIIKNITTLSDSQNTNLLNELATFNSAFSFSTSGSGSTTVLSITPNVPFTSLSILDTSVSPNVGRLVATQKWVSDNYVPLSFFKALFTAYDGSGNGIEPSTWTSSTVINRLKILVGTWTDQYLSAYGLNSSGGGGGGSSTLAGLTDTAIASPSSGQVLVYDGLSHKWVNGAAQSGGGIISISMSVPTGFSVSPSTISNNGGTFAITFASGYALPTTAKQDEWDEAYGWGDHSEAGYLTDQSLTITTLQSYFTNGVANVAEMLNTGNTTYTAWGRTFWTNGKPTSISGEIKDASHIRINNSASIYWKTSPSSTTLTEQYISILTLDSDNNFVVGESMRQKGLKTRIRGKQVYLQSGTSDNDEHRAILDENGMLTVEKLKIGDIVIEYSSQNSGLHIVNAGVYADTYFSAYGIGSGGSGGGTSLNQPLSGINSAGLGTPNVTGSAIVWNGSSWTYSGNTTLRASAIQSLGSITSYGSVTSQYGNFITSASYGFKVTGKTNDYILTAGGGTKLFKLAIDSASLEDGQALVYDESTSSWVNGEGGTALPLAANGTRGGVQIGYTTDATNRNYAIQLSSEKMYVNVPWEGFTAGNYATTNKLFFIGATSCNTATQNSSVHTYTNTKCYIYQSELYSNESKVITESTETKNTAGNFDIYGSPSAAYRIYLVGVASYGNNQTSIAATSVNRACYIDTNNCLYSNGSKVLTAAETGFLPLTGGDLTGTLTVSKSGIPVSWYANDAPFLRIQASGTQDMLCFAIASTGESMVQSAQTGVGLRPLLLNPKGGNVAIGKSDPSYKLDVNGTIQGTAVRIANGTSSQFLKADGSVDSNTYLTSGTNITQVKVIKADPSTTTYYPTFFGSVPSTNDTGNVYVNNGLKYTTNIGTSSAAGSATLIIGNGSLTTSEKKIGKVCLVSTVGSVTIVTDANVDYTQTLPSKSGTFAMLDDVPSTSNFLPKSGGDLTGRLKVHVDGIDAFTWASDYGFIQLKAKDTDHILGFAVASTGEGLIQSSTISVGGTSLLINRRGGNVAIGKSDPAYKLDVNGTIQGTAVRIANGTSSQFLKADGSVDSNTYLTSGTNITQVKVIKADPSTTTYYPTFFGSVPSTNDTGNVYVNNGLKYKTNIGTSSAAGSATLIIGNGSLTTSEKKIGKLCLVSTVGSVTIVTDANVDYTQTLPSKSGTFAMIGDIPTKTSDITNDSGFITCSVTDTLTVSKSGIPVSWYANDSPTIKIQATGTQNMLCFAIASTGESMVQSAQTGVGTRPLLLNPKGGYIAIGHTSPSYPLHVKGIGYFTGKVYSEGYEVLTSGNVVTTSSDQSIAGLKTFTNNMSVNANLTCSSQVTCTNERVSNCLTVGYSQLVTGYNLYVNGTSYLNGSTTINGSLSFTISGSEHIMASSVMLKISATTLTVSAASFGGNVPYTGGSDIRKKNIVSNIGASIEQIAKAPIFNFRWKDDTTMKTFVGTSAQYWKQIFPCAVVIGQDGYFAMDYAGTALAAAVITARTVQNHEDRILELERENEALRKEIETLKAA